MQIALEERRRRAVYRAAHRGTKEMDWLLGRYAAAQLAAMGDDELDLFEELVAMPDPTLQTWIMTGSAPVSDSELERKVAPLIARIRAFHSIDDATAA